MAQQGARKIFLAPAGLVGKLPRQLSQALQFLVFIIVRRQKEVFQHPGQQRPPVAGGAGIGQLLPKLAQALDETTQPGDQMGLVRRRLEGQDIVPQGGVRHGETRQQPVQRKLPGVVPLFRHPPAFLLAGAVQLPARAGLLKPGDDVFLHIVRGHAEPPGHGGDVQQFHHFSAAEAGFRQLQQGQKAADQGGLFRQGPPGDAEGNEFVSARLARDLVSAEH